MTSETRHLCVTDNLSIPLAELQEQFVRAAGPGGQHVNKTATAVQLRYDVRNSPSLDEQTRARLIVIAGNRINSAGELVLTARRFRSREQNRRDARERLATLVRRAARRPTRRVGTRVPGAERRKRLDNKRRRGRTKNLRRNPPRGD